MTQIAIAFAFFTFLAMVFTWVVTRANRSLIAPEVPIDRFALRTFLCFVPLILMLTWLITS